jgi:hypothetical protein
MGWERKVESILDGAHRAAATTLMVTMFLLITLYAHTAVNTGETRGFPKRRWRDMDFRTGDVVLFRADQSGFDSVALKNMFTHVGILMVREGRYFVAEHVYCPEEKGLWCHVQERLISCGFRVVELDVLLRNYKGRIFLRSLQGPPISDTDAWEACNHLKNIPYEENLVKGDWALVVSVASSPASPHLGRIMHSEFAGHRRGLICSESACILLQCLQLLPSSMEMLNLYSSLPMVWHPALRQQMDISSDAKETLSSSLLPYQYTPMSFSSAGGLLDGEIESFRPEWSWRTEVQLLP